MSNDFLNIDSFLLTRNARIIHQIWFGTIPNKHKAKKTYEKLKIYRNSWIQKNPEWYRMEWNYDLCQQLLKQIYPEHLELFKKYEYEIQRCDAIRYLILHRYGGWYADMDYYCNRPLDDVHQKFKDDIYLVETPNKLTDSEHVSNSLMYSIPNHAFWKYLMIELEKHNSYPSYYGKHLTVMLTTGPGILNRVYHTCKYRYRLKFLPSDLFHPFGIKDEIRSVKKISSKIYAVHVSNGSWTDLDSDIINLVYRDIIPFCVVIFFLILMYILLR